MQQIKALVHTEKRSDCVRRTTPRRKFDGIILLRFLPGTARHNNVIETPCEMSLYPPDSPFEIHSDIFVHFFASHFVLQSM